MTRENEFEERTTGKRQLSNREQLLLSRFHDGECSRITEFFAKRLLLKNEAARGFLSDLEQISKNCRGLISTAPKLSTNLWERINNRIEQEERAELYLGSRRIRSDNPSPSHRASWDWAHLRHALVGGVSGAAVASLLLASFPETPKVLPFLDFPTSQIGVSGGMRPVITNESNLITNGYQPRLINRRVDSLEMDWMRANGSLKLIPDPSGSSAIIWVRRRNGLNSSSYRRGIPSFGPTPFGLNLTPVYDGQKVILDETPRSDEK